MFESFKSSTAERGPEMAAELGGDMAGLQEALARADINKIKRPGKIAILTLGLASLFAAAPKAEAANWEGLVYTGANIGQQVWQQKQQMKMQQEQMAWQVKMQQEQMAMQQRQQEMNMKMQEQQQEQSMKMQQRQMDAQERQQTQAQNAQERQQFANNEMQKTQMQGQREVMFNQQRMQFCQDLLHNPNLTRDPKLAKAVDGCINLMLGDQGGQEQQQPAGRAINQRR